MIFNYDVTDLQNAISSEATTRANADTAIQNSIGTYVKPNLLDNWYFVGGGSQQSGKEFPINQRGQTSYGTSQYTVDRWYNDQYGTGVAVTSGYLTLMSGTDIMQVVVRTFPLGKLTMSALDESGNLISGTVDYADQTTPFTFAYENNIQLYGVYNGVGGIYIFIAAVGANKGIQAVKLELGDTQTLAHQDNGVWVLNEIPNYQQELAKCQRYFVKYGSIDCFGTVTSSSLSYYIDVPVPVTMARVPTISFDSMVIRTPTGYSNRTPSGTATSPVSIQSIESRNNQVTFVDRLSASVGDTNNVMLYYTLSNLSISADL